MGLRRNVTWPRFRTGTAYGTHSLGVRQHAYSQKIVEYQNGFEKKNIKWICFHIGRAYSNSTLKKDDMLSNEVTGVTGAESGNSGRKRN